MGPNDRLVPRCRCAIDHADHPGVARTTVLRRTLRVATRARSLTPLRERCCLVSVAALMVSSRSDEFGRLFVEELCEFPGGHGPAEEVTLSRRAAESAMCSAWARCSIPSAMVDRCMLADRSMIVRTRASPPAAPLVAASTKLRSIFKMSTGNWRGTRVTSTRCRSRRSRAEHRGL